MIYCEELIRFLNEAREDGRVGPSHISLYLAILQLADSRGENPICAFSKDLMPLAKISGSATFNKNIWDLHCYGYIKYLPSYNHFLGSLIYISNV